MAINIYVGNLSFQATEKDLQELFGEFGSVSRVSIIRDKETGKSRGFAFVEMPDRESGMRAISQLNDTEVVGRRVNVNEAKPREDKVGAQDGRRRNER